MVTIKDIARELDIGVNTVSRALNNKPDVSPTTRARVLMAAQRMGYVPNTMAKAMVTRRTFSLGLLTTTPSNPMFAQLVDVIEEACSQRGYSLVLANSRERLADEEQALRTFRQQRVDGLLIVPVQGNYAHLQEAVRLGLPMVTVLRPLPQLGVDHVGYDNVEGAREVARHLISLGHRQIAIIREKGEITTVRDRLTGYRQALVQHGIELPPELCVETTLSFEGGYAATRDLQARGCPFTALLLSNDIMAPGVYAALREARREVPRDVAVAGFGNAPFSPFLNPPLTTVQTPITEVGRTAVELIMNRLEGVEAAPQRVVLHPRLVVRSSSGVPERRENQREVEAG